MSMLTEKLWIFDQSSFKVAHIRQTFSRHLHRLFLWQGNVQNFLASRKNIKTGGKHLANVCERERTLTWMRFSYLRQHSQMFASQWDRAFKETAILYNTVYPIADEYSNGLFILFILGRCRRGPFIHYLWLILVTSGALPNWGIEPATPVSQHWQQTLTSELKCSISLHQVWFY